MQNFLTRGPEEAQRATPSSQVLGSGVEKAHRLSSSMTMTSTDSKRKRSRPRSMLNVMTLLTMAAQDRTVRVVRNEDYIDIRRLASGPGHTFPPIRAISTHGLKRLQVPQPQAEPRHKMSKRIIRRRHNHPSSAGSSSSRLSE